MNTKTAAALAAAMLFATGAGPALAGPNDEAPIRKLLEHWHTAFQAKDIDGIMSIYSRDVVAYDIVAPLQYVGYDAYRKDYQAFLGQFKGPLKVEMRDVHIETGDTVAVAFMLERISGVMQNGQPFDGWMRTTETYRKIKGRWYAVHDHISVPADMETGKALLELKP